MSTKRHHHRAVIVSCRGADSGLSVERPGVGGARPSLLNGWLAQRTTRLFTHLRRRADFAGCRSGLKNWRSVASDQMITVNLLLYLGFSGIAAWRMPSARCTLTPCSFCAWKVQSCDTSCEKDRIPPPLSVPKSHERRYFTHPGCDACRGSFTYSSPP